MLQISPTKYNYGWDYGEDLYLSGKNFSPASLDVG
jgi:hypothetical protein